MSEIRTRFAPSPTGFLHVGSARTALFNWAFARRHGGKLVLRIEDTDRERSTAESERAVIEGLEWLGIDWDEGPLRQSAYADRHRAAVERMLANGRAYRCVCSAEQLEKRRQATIAAGEKWTYDGRCRDLDLGADPGPHTVRLRLPESGFLGWDDGVFGPSGQDASEIGDRIIQRSDGQPLYHLAVVVDDIEMRITHVIRGADHHPNTPLQIALYRALEAEPPAFAHVPLIVGAGGKKLSKRRDPVSVQNFREEGYLAPALRNWLIRIGWSHGDQEVFSSEEICALFDLDAVNRSAAQADADKLLWLNQHYLKQLPAPDLAAELAPFLSAEIGREVPVTAELAELAELQRERGKTLSEMARLSRWFVVDEVDFDPKAVAKHLKPAIEPALRALLEGFEKLEGWSREPIEAVFLETLAAHGDLKMGKLAQPVRVAVTGGSVSPGIFETLEVLGQARALARMKRAIDLIDLG
ncbi:MAG: glutamate--tRNA ligase [Deltaproteobacteria bacterium]|jgi:glutamyl-tRNA synthetase|nr:glutamate--tRNA ligase [Deltaproteobacteria bacterium]MBW2542856.1 glutamate--tRNA ligase [Deltaproteobacteria bacterium]